MKAQGGINVVPELTVAKNKLSKERRYSEDVLFSGSKCSLVKAFKI